MIGLSRQYAVYAFDPPIHLAGPLLSPDNVLVNGKGGGDGGIVTGQSKSRGGHGATTVPGIIADEIMMNLVLAAYLYGRSSRVED
jgi:hypothetical protein